MADLWAYVKRYRVVVISNLVICICSVAVIAQCCLVNDWFHIENIKKNDFAVYYEFSRFFMQGRLGEIYDEALIIEAGTYQFRYLPTFLVFMMPFAILGDLVLAYVVFSIVSFLLNVVSMYLIDRAVQLFRPGTGVVRYAWLALLVFAHLSNYPTGQPTSFVLFCTALSLKYFMEGKEGRASAWLGISIILKPMMYGVVLFTFLSAKSIRQAVKRGLCAVLPLAVDAVLLLVVPRLLGGFLERNLGDSEGYQFISLSLVNVLALVTGGYRGVLFVTTLAALSIAGYLGIKKVADARQRVLLSFVLGTLVFFVVQPQLWMASLVLLYPMFALAPALLHKAGERRVWIVALVYNAASTYIAFQQVIWEMGPFLQAIVVAMVATCVVSPIAIMVLVLRYPASPSESSS